MLGSLTSLQLGEAVTAGSLAMFPLLAPEAGEADYLTLDEAVLQKLAEVSEISDAGTVGQLRIVNSATKPVLLLDGEELVGAKQNRIVNLSILVAARSVLDIPVTCVEAGRWGYRSRVFAPSGRAHYASARAAKVSQVNRSMAADGSRYADQNAVWADIDAKAQRMQSVSSTQAAEAMYERVAAPLDEFIKSFEPLPGQIGAVFAVRGRVAGLEAFDSPHTWRKQVPKIIRSYGLDAFDTRGDLGDAGDPRTFVEALVASPTAAAPALGIGTDVRVETLRIRGAALVRAGALVHVLAFAAP